MPTGPAAARDKATIGANMRTTILPIAAMVALLSAGCSSSDPMPPAVSSSAERTGADPFQDGGDAPASTETPVDAVKRYLAARAAGDGATVCALYTDTLAAEELSTTDEEDATTCAESISLEGPNDFFDPDRVERITEIPGSVYGTEVVVKYSTSEDHVVLEEVNGAWRIRNVLDS